MAVYTLGSHSHFPFRWLGILALLLLCAGCNPIRTQTADATPTPSPARTPPPNADFPSFPGAVSGGNRTLVIWMPAFAGVTGNQGAGGVVNAALRRFEVNHPGLRIEIHAKAETGTASLFNHLRSAQRVASGILPDLVLINTQQLWPLVDFGLIPPLADSELPTSTGYYPFAWDAVVYRDRSYGFPYAATVIHQIYDQETQPVPQTAWPATLAGSGPWRYPAAGGELFDNASVLLQYVGAGGQLLEDGTVSDPNALSAVFDFLVAARNQEIIPADVVEIATLDAAWSAFRAQPAGMANVASSTYLAQGGTLPQAKFAAVPTRDGQPMTIANTWALAVITSEDTKRRDALDLVEALLAPQVQGAWSQDAHVLPTTRAGLALWAQSDAYTTFLDRQLDAAVALPNGPDFAQFAAQVMQAQIGVLTGNLSPAAALESIATP